MKILEERKVGNETEMVMEFNQKEHKMFRDMYSKLTIEHYIQMLVKNAIMEGVLREDLKPYACLYGFRKEVCIVYATSKEEARKLVYKQLRKITKGELKKKELKRWMKKHVEISNANIWDVLKMPENVLELIKF